MNWPDRALSTNLRGNGSAAGDSTRPACVVGGGRGVNWVGCTACTTGVEVVMGGMDLLLLVSGTEANRCGGGRVPSAGWGGGGGGGRVSVARQRGVSTLLLHSELHRGCPCV